MRTKRGLIGAVLLVLLAAGPPQAPAALLELSDYSSDGNAFNAAEYLTADLAFAVVDTSLTLTVTNRTFNDYPNTNQTAFDITELYFNIDPQSNVAGLTLGQVWWCDPNGTKIDGNKLKGWTNGVSTNGYHVNGFGMYDVHLVGSNPPVISPTGTGGVYTVQFVFTISGTGPFSDADFTTSLSGPFDNDPMLGLAAGKFIHGGPTHSESAYGVVVPEPATICLLALGATALIRRRRRVVLSSASS